MNLLLEWYVMLPAGIIIGLMIGAWTWRDDTSPNVANDEVTRER